MDGTETLACSCIGLRGGDCDRIRGGDCERIRGGDCERIRGPALATTETWLPATGVWLREAAAEATEGVPCITVADAKPCGLVGVVEYDDGAEGVLAAVAIWCPSTFLAASGCGLELLALALTTSPLAVDDVAGGWTVPSFSTCVLGKSRRESLPTSAFSDASITRNTHLA